MIATIINAVAIVVGGLLGLIIKGRFNKKLQAIASQATGLSVLVVGLNTALTQLITQPCNSVLFVISLVVGGLIGTVINVEGRLQALGRWVEKKVGGRKGGVSRAFVTATLLYCVGSMAVVGSIESGLHHNYSILLTKSIMDMIYAVIIASTLGYGVIVFFYGYSFGKKSEISGGPSVALQPFELYEFRNFQSLFRTS